MKKIMSVAFVLAFALLSIACLSGCSIATDDDYAVAEVTTSDGQAFVLRSFNGSGTSYSGKTYAFDRAAYLSISAGETAHIHFFCDTCGHDEECDIDAPFSKVFSCDCPKATDEDKDGNDVREYLVIVSTSEPTNSTADETAD